MKSFSILNEKNPMDNPTKSSTSGQLFKCVMRIVANNKKLAIFPALSLLSCTFLLAIFAAPAFLEPTGHAWNQVEYWQVIWGRFADVAPTQAHHFRAWHLKSVTYVWLGVLYLITMVATTFFNVALYHEAMKAMAGERSSIRRGMAFASGRIQSILVWSLFAGSVGLLLQAVAERLGPVGKFVIRLIGLSWSVAAVFVIPVMVREESANPVTLLKSSVQMLKRTWGDALLGFVKIRFAAVFILMVMCVWGFMFVSRAGNVNVERMVVLGAFFSAVFILQSFVLGFVNDIYRCALYVFASEGVVPEPFSEDDMNAAWKVKTK